MGISSFFRVIDRAMFFILFSVYIHTRYPPLPFHLFYVSFFLLKPYRMELSGTLQSEKDGVKRREKEEDVSFILG